MDRRWPYCLLAGGFLLPMVVAISVFARSDGIDGYSGNPGTNGGLTCTICHSGGVVPGVVLTGPTAVLPGATHTYTLTVSGGQEVAAGLDVSASDGTFVVIDPGTYLKGGEITHLEPRPVDGNGDVLFSFNWTAPAQETSVDLFGAGNSVNLAQGTNGDNAAADILTVTVAASSPGPGETAGPAEETLTVTGFDDLSGDIAIRFGSGCETTGNNIYFGSLEDVDFYGWSGQECNIGAGPEYAGFNPGPGSFFFVVVGTKDADEGSYGRNRLADGSENERPPHGGATCGQSQTLADRCDVP